MREEEYRNGKNKSYKKIKKNPTDSISNLIWKEENVLEIIKESREDNVSRKRDCKH